MARDYKRRTSRRRGKARKPPQGLTFLAAGFGLGVIASIVLYRMFAPLPPVGPDTPVPTAQREPQSAVEAEAEQAATTLPPPSGRRARKQLEFYEVLPNYEVIVPESDERVAVAKPLEKIDKAGAYVLQAGSFRRFADADRRKAELALRGVESQIQRVTIGDDETWHRVRVGPLTDLDRVNQLRRELHAANIDVMLLRVAE